MIAKKALPNDHVRGQRIRAARARAGWTQQRLAAVLGISPQYLSNIEHGSARCTYDLFRRCAAALEMADDEWIVAPPTFTTGFVPQE